MREGGEERNLFCCYSGVNRVTLVLTASVTSDWGYAEVQLDSVGGTVMVIINMIGVAAVQQPIDPFCVLRFLGYHMEQVYALLGNGNGDNLPPMVATKIPTIIKGRKTALGSLSKKPCAR